MPESGTSQSSSETLTPLPSETLSMAGCLPRAVTSTTDCELCHENHRGRGHEQRVRRIYLALREQGRACH